MSLKTASRLKSKSVQPAVFRLNKITSLMLASAVLSMTALNAGAQSTPRPSGVTLPNGLSGSLDGGRQSGFLITGDERFGGDADVTFGVGGSNAPQSLVHNFKTTGGAGSGGGAGLGGAFFVDAGAKLTVINTDFVSNRVQGGTGGSLAPVSYAGRVLNVIGETVELNPVPVVGPDLVTLNGQIIENQTFTRTVSNNTVSYAFRNLSVSDSTAKFLAPNSTVIFNDYQGATSTINRISGNLVEFSNPVTTTATSIGTATSAQDVVLAVRRGTNVFSTDPNERFTVKDGGTTGFRLEGGSVKIDYGFVVEYVQTGVELDGTNQTPVFKPVSIAQASQGLNSVNQGDKVFIGTVNGVAQIATVREVIRYSDENTTIDSLVGKPKELILDITPTGSTNFLDIIKAPSFDAIPFVVDSGNRRRVNTFDTSAKYTPGMTVTWEANGVDVSATVVSVTGQQVVLDKEVPTGVTSLNFVENPVVAANSVRISGASATFKPGQVVYVPSTERETFVGTVTAVDPNTNVVTVSPQTAGQKLSDYYNPSLGLGLKVSAGTLSGNNRITVPFNTNGTSVDDISKLLVGRLVNGASFADETKVTKVTSTESGFITLELSQPVSSSVIESFSLSSPLTMGGNMNGLTDTFARNDSNNGTRGFSANSASSFFNDAEGVDGTNGKSAKDATDGRGYSGGAGGNGSNGLPVNFWLVYDVTVASIQLKQATRNLVIAADELVHAGLEATEKATELAAAIAPDPQGGLAFVGPDPAEIVAAKLAVKNAANEVRLKTKNKINANFDLVWAISDLAMATTNLGKWATELGLGLAGLGGAGGDGGQASGGADFFGGGAGGAGGNGGSGATAISDGGDGGSGGMGGAGGFGAGGGQGGKGGLAGANGNAGGGDPGDGGFAGFGAGEGANGDGNFGGGGAGLGGSIFVRTGGTLLIQGNARFENNYVAGGSTSSQFGEAGSEAGTDLFIMKDSLVRLLPGKGKTIEFYGTIADDSFATNDGFQNAAGFGSDVRIGGTSGGGGGLVVFNGENTYSGNTILEGATLLATLGLGVNDMSVIRFNGSGSMGVNLSTNQVSSTLSLDSVGTFLLGENFSRRSESDPGGTVWTGSGGFASSGTMSMVTVNLGAIDDNGRGQNLVWGSDGFFVTPQDGNGSGSNGVLTFGSDYSQGTVKFTNNVNLNNNIARVAVYKTNSYSSSNATLSGQWTNTGNSSTLMVGDSSGSNYNGTLFMTGQNSLDNLVVAGGTLSTFNSNGAAGKLFKNTSNLAILADKDSNQQSYLQLFAPERLTNVSILGGGNLTLTQALTATGSFTNKGSLFVLGTHFGNQSEQLKTTLINAAGMSDYLPSDFSTWNGSLTVTGDFVNQGEIHQFGAITADNLTNAAGSKWQSTGDLSAGTDFINNNLYVSVGNISAGRDVINTGNLSLTGNLSAVGDIKNLGTGVVNVIGNVTAGNDLTNQDNLLASGKITVNRDLTNLGVITAGSMQVTLGNVLNDGSIAVNDGLEVRAGSLRNLDSTTLTVGDGVFVGLNLQNDGAMSVLKGGLTVGSHLTNTDVVSVSGNTSVGLDLSNQSTGTLAITAGTLGVGRDLNNEGLASVDGKLTVGNRLTNTNRLTVRQGGLEVVNQSLTNSGILDVTGDTKIKTDLSNSNGNSNTLAQLLVKEGKLDVGGRFDNSGIANIAGQTTVASHVVNSARARLTVGGGGLVVGASLENLGLTDVTGEVTVANGVLNASNATLTVRNGGLKVEGAYTNAGTSTVQGDSLVRFDLNNSGNLNFANNLDVVGSFNNAGGVAQVTGRTSVKFDLVNTAGAATLGNDVNVEGHLRNLSSGNTLPAMTITGNVTVARDLLNQGAMSIVGNTTSTGGSVTNTGGLSMTGNLTTAANQSVVNDGYWGIGKDASITTGQLQGASGAVFCLSTANNQACSADGATATNLSLDLRSSNRSTFAGVFAGAGSLTKTGQSELVLTNDQTFSGGLTINGGRVVAEGRMNDLLDITVNAGTYVVMVGDTVKSVLNNAPRSVVLNADLTTTQGFVNNGRLEVNGTANFNNGTSTVERRLDAGTQGFSGNANGLIEVQSNTTFRLSQSGDSVYQGVIERGNDNSALVKEGSGKLTLSNTIDLKNIRISAGELALNKAGILSQDAIVDIALGARLSLLVGNQSIDELKGAGSLFLGANNLSINRGGTFNGVIDGTGQVAVNQGAFSISNSLKTTDAAFVVSATSETNLENTAELEAKQLDVRGQLTLGTSSASRATLAAKNGVNVYSGGALRGTGHIKDGITTVHSGGLLQPGNSPGVLTFTDGLQLSAGSVTEMEILNPVGSAGVGFDRLNIGPDASFKIVDGASLSINKSGDPAPLAMGQTVKLFDFTPGKIEGQFGSVTSNVAGLGALSLATGNVVGLGAATMSQIRNTAITANEKAIYAGLLQSTAGGVAQFYGGQFIERLVNAAGAGSVATKAVFNAYNPETYLGLSDMSQAAAQDALPVWKSQLGNTDKLFAYAASTTRANQQNPDHQTFGLNVRTSNIGATRQWGKNTVVMSFGVVDPMVRSNYVFASGNGFNTGVSVYGPAKALPNSLWFVGLSHADLKMNGTRSIAQSRFRDVGTSSTQLEAGLESRYSFNNNYVMMRGAFAVGQAQRDRVNETGDVNALNTLTVHADKYHYNQLALAVELGKQVSSLSNWYASLNYEAGNQNKNSVTVGYDNDQARFAVNGQSAMTSNARLMTGIRHQYSQGTTLESAIGLARGWNGGSDVQARIGLVKKF